MTSSTDQQADATVENDAGSDADDAYDDDLDFAPHERAGLGRLTTGLIAAIVLVLVFGGGVWAQKHYGKASSGANAAGPAGARAFGASGFNREGATGGFSPPGGTTGTGATDTTGTGTGTTGTTGTTGSASAATPAVIGTVTTISGRTVRVKNFAGRTVTVTVPKTATVTTVGSLDGLTKGASVTVVGKADSDGDVTASAVTVR